MNKRMTWDEIKRFYPDTWVKLTDVTYGSDGVSVESAVVEKSGKMDEKDFDDYNSGRCLQRYIESGRKLFVGALSV